MPQTYKRDFKASPSELYEIANELRQDVIEMLSEAKSGHPGGAMGLAEIYAVLYFNYLNIDPETSNTVDRDRFVLSNGHTCPILYAALAKRGYFDRSELWGLRKTSGILQGHPSYRMVPGIENTSGSLGQGLSQAIGIALAGKLDEKNFRVICLTGDGELQEGQIWEAALFGADNNLINLTWIIDRNNIQIDNYTEHVMPLENLKDKLEAFNWYVLEIDGHNVEEIINALNMAKSIKTRPTAIIAHTIPGKGVGFMEYKFEWHGKPPSKDEAALALRELRSLKGKITYYD